MHLILAANLSPALIQVLRENPSLVDAVKVSEFGDPQYVEECRRLVPLKRLILHGICQNTDWGRFRPPSPGNPGFKESVDRRVVATAVEVVKPQYISVHLERPLAASSGGGHLAWDTPLDGDAFIARLIGDVDFMRSITGLPVHLENTHTISHPAFITKALDATEARFLLDIAHAQVAAWHRGEAVEAYLDCLPLDRVDEVHVCAPAMVNGELRDRHAPMGEEEYRLLGYVLARAPVKTVSLEYGGYGPIFQSRSSLPVLVEQLERLGDLLT